MEITYTIYLHRLILEYDIKKLDETVEHRIKQTIREKLQTRPEIFGAPLRGILKGYRKLRIENYRVIFRIEKQMVIIVGILHRSKAYEEIERRINNGLTLEN